MRNNFQPAENGNRKLKFCFSTKKVSHINLVPVCHTAINTVLNFVHSVYYLYVKITNFTISMLS